MAKKTQKRTPDEIIELPTEMLSSEEHVEFAEAHADNRCPMVRAYAFPRTDDTNAILFAVMNANQHTPADFSTVLRLTDALIADLQDRRKLLTTILAGMQKKENKD